MKIHPSVLIVPIVAPAATGCKENARMEPRNYFFAGGVAGFGSGM
jgi:hypothetical protein